jgi:tRNA(adenine34) deaminase
VNFALYMSEAIAEARLGASRGERAQGVVAVLDDAMVARAHDQVVATGDPTAHAVVVALREVARRLGREALDGLTVFVALEPCPMCVGALLECDVDTLVYAVPDPRFGAAGSAVQLARHDGLPRRLKVVSGILQEDAAEVVGAPPAGPTPPAGANGNHQPGAGGR